MEKRAVLAIILSVVVILGYDILFVPKNKQQPIEQKIASKVEPQDVSPQQYLIKEEAHQSIEVNLENRIFELENDKFILSFDSWGARLLKVTLKDYLDSKKNPIELIDIKTTTPFSPLGLSASDSPYDLINSAYNAKVDMSENGKRVVFTKRFEEIELRKTFSITSSSYIINLAVDWKNLTDKQLNIPNYNLVWEPNIYNNKKENPTDEIRIVSNINNKIRKQKLRKVKEKIFNHDYTSIAEIETNESLKWLAISSQYFMSALIPEDSTYLSIIEKIDSPKGMERGRIMLSIPQATILQNSSLSNNFEIYVGPKEISILQPLGNKMEDNIDFGFFGAFSKFLLYALRYINRFVNNFGWSIVILSVLIKAITYPLAHKSFVSMKKMQKVTPLVADIRKKYKDNQQKVNQEIMALYKRHKVNPMGGCLPMVIQLPVLFGLFNTLRSAIELRGAPFIFWLTDLSQKDPYYILPLLMGITMFLQQKMTPVTDPKQAKMMYIMPVAMTFLFLKLSSGLFIYFIISNVLTIAQQYMINKQVN